MKAEIAEDARQILSVGPNTYVSLAFVISFVSAIAIGSWRMSAISAKLDSITSMLSVAVKENDDLKARFTMHETEQSKLQAEVNTIRQAGSPQLQALERRVNEIDVRLSVHEKSFHK